MNKQSLMISRVMLGIFIGAMLVASARAFDVHLHDINGSRIGDSQNDLLRKMSANFPARSVYANRTVAGSKLYTRPVSCAAATNGITRCQAKFAEMTMDQSHKQFLLYRDLVAEFNRDQELAFLSLVTTTHHDNKATCQQAAAEFYKQTSAQSSSKPKIVYPRSQLDIYYMKIDEQPFATRMMGKLHGAFSMVWQKQRNDWSSFYSVDFGCRDSGHLVVNETLFDKSVKAGLRSASNLGPELSLNAN
jgi:hypothetical protein